MDWWRSLVLFDNAYGIAPYPQPNSSPAGEGRESKPLQQKSRRRENSAGFFDIAHGSCHMARALHASHAT
ncbi:hypothetical protein XFF6166_50038 [Xanthomonas citri pv. fuscans]|uniref:Uncharacterized protein n=1 Tax=Xanthomonas campestris pv. phaseoli TaxID=317013 RepID=A0A7Z7IW46_XANCH|nr:hypothetical protein XFF6166_50038 [Xanthomonas citri pv. fuscans]SOO22686.1 hypothetical protein XFF6991_150450 [Xanthomonas phaseoli pv. phaseoli]SON96556.1 hypothetical protein XFF6990_340060 [Xanthomonas citri pv. fuscans]SON99084.1 hypothetical protein XFF6960_120038 [Xanthomonas citri pv. fuscans]SOO03998.1 hypothetical protein XFF7767_210012 [Xanthomonas citri pv. fuscans]